MNRKEKILGHFKMTKELYLAFLIPFLIMLGVCIAKGIYPFGDQCFLHIDMYHQYCPFFAEFQERLQNGNSLMYAWELGLGSDFMALYAYYLASPMNWLVFLCPKGLVIEFMTLLIIIKVALCGFSFAYYLRKHFDTKSFSVVLFSTFYALSAFTCAYNWNIMWMDGIWLAPLIILGLEKLVNEKKYTLYYITLAVSIVSNFYISVMICIYLVIYYLILMIERKGKDFLRTTGRFALYSALAGGTAAVLILPVLSSLSVSNNSGISFPKYVQWYFNAVDELARLCISVEVVPTTAHWPNIYCGCAAILLIMLYIMNKEIPWKKKLARILLLGFFLVSFANNVLTFIWHGLEFPSGLPARQSFLFIFLMLVLCFETVHRSKGNSKLQIGIALVIGLLLMLVFGAYADKERITMVSILMTGVLMAAYAMIYLFYIGKDKLFYRMGCIFACILVVVEATVNLDATSISTTSRNNYTVNLPKYEALLERLEETDDGFYRIDKHTRLTKNEATLVGYKSASIFSTLLNIHVANWYREAGLEGGLNYYCYNGASPLTGAMLSVKYLYTSSAQEESPFRKLVDSEDGMYLYENLYSLPLGFMVDEAFIDCNELDYDSSIVMQNDMVRTLGANEPLFTEIETEVKTKETIIHVKEDSYVMGYYYDKRAKKVTADWGYKKRDFLKCDHVYLLDLGWCEAGTDITLTSPDINVLQIQGQKLNVETLNTAYEKLKSQTMELVDYTDTSVEGKIDVKESGKLLLTIPAESGWTIWVDGEEIEPDTFAEAFFAIPLEAGSHEISMKYQTPGLVAGALISAGCVGVFVAITIVGRRKKRR